MGSLDSLLRTVRNTDPAVAFFLAAVATVLAYSLEGTFRGLFAVIAFVLGIEGFTTWRRNMHARAYLPKLPPDELGAVADCVRRSRKSLRCDPDTARSLRDNYVAWPDKSQPGEPSLIRDYVWRRLQHPRRKQEILSRADAQERARAST
jgi:hypothetical protein